MTVYFHSMSCKLITRALALVVVFSLLMIGTNNVFAQKTNTVRQGPQWFFGIKLKGATRQQLRSVLAQQGAALTEHNRSIDKYDISKLYSVAPRLFVYYTNNWFTSLKYEFNSEMPKGSFGSVLALLSKAYGPPNYKRIADGYWFGTSTASWDFQKLFMQISEDKINDYTDVSISDMSEVDKSLSEYNQRHHIQIGPKGALPGLK